MKPIATICLSATLLLFYACSPDTPTVLQTIDLTGEIKKQKDIKLSDIATDIRYVKLEGTPECFIQQVESAVVNENHFLILDQMSGKILLFSADGKFLRSISRPGKGPGEYTRHPQISFDPSGSKIYILSFKKLDMFTLDGTWTGSIPMDPSPDQVIDLGDKFLLTFPYPSSINNEDFHFSLLDKKGNLVRKFFKWENFKANSQDARYLTRVRLYRDTLLYKNKYCDTLYGITKNLEVVNRWVISQRTPQNPSNPNDEFTGFRPGGFAETPDYFFCVASLDRIMHPFMYDKKSGEVLYFPYDKELYGYGLVNDLDGGAPFWLGSYINGKSYSFDYPHKIKLTVEITLARNIPVKYPDKKQKLIELINSITEEDNQILTIVTLKQ